MRLGLVQALDEASEVERRYPPLGLAYIASYLRQHLGLRNIVFGVRAEDLIAEKPDLVALSAVSHNWGRALDIAQRLKAALGVPIVVGGPHISYLPHWLPKAFDVGVLGEGEETVAELVRSFRVGYGFDPEDLAEIDGLVFWRDGRRVVTRPRQLIRPLDHIPIPARDLFEDNWGKHFAEDMHILTARGCPYRCRFCASTQFWDQVRFFSPEYVAAEIKHLIDAYGVKRINIYDDLFISHRQRFRAVSAQIQAQGLHRKVSFYCSVRANLLDDDIYQELRRMGVDAVGWGAESGSDAILQWLGKTGATVADNQRAIDLCHKYGLRPTCSFIIGTSVESEADLLQTYAFIKKNMGRLEAIDVYPLVPYPGTEVWEEALARGLVGEDMDWDAVAQDPATFDLGRYILLNPRYTKEQCHLYFLLFQELSQLVRDTWHWGGAQSQMVHAQGEAARLRGEVARLQELVAGYERGRFIRAMAWLHRVRTKLAPAPKAPAEQPPHEGPVQIQRRTT